MQVALFGQSPFVSTRVAVAMTALLVASLARAGGDDVAIVRAAPWSPGDGVREGAGEFEVLFKVASLQKNHQAVGLVGVGDRNGHFPSGAERALRFVAMRGVPVARLAAGGHSGLSADGIFLDGGNLTESGAAAVLDQCLRRLGPAPAAIDPDRPTAHELAALQAYLAPFRRAFAVANSASLTAE